MTGLVDVAKAMTTVALLCGGCAAVQAGSFVESNPLYDLEISYGFEGEQVWHEVELTNKLEIEIAYGHIDATLECASGARHASPFRVREARLAAGATQRFRVEDDGCRPTTRRDPATGRSEEVADEIRGVSYSGRIEMAQHGASFVGLTWDCGDEEIIVTAIKFPRGTGFRLIASNDRSMTVAGKLDPHAAVSHLCGRNVEDAPGIASGIRKLIGEVRTLCETAPHFCDKAYDVNNKRAATAVRG